MALVLKNGTVYVNGEFIEADVLINNGKVEEIGNGLEAEEVEDVSGLYVLPGFIDVHVHFREPGHEYKEDFLTGSKAAAAGGVTTILAMPNTNPPIVSAMDLEMAKKLAEKSIVNYGLYAGATAGNVATVGQLENAVAVKAYVGASTGTLLLDQHEDFEKLLQHTKKLVVVHAEDQKLLNEFAEKHKDTKQHHLIRDNQAAITATERVVNAANKLKKRVHIAHMSTKEEVDFLRQNKTKYVTCEVSPHHLFLSNKFFDKEGNKGKMNPPLRTNENVETLWRGIDEGVIDIIATDHAPHTLEEKQADYDKAPSGIPGVQTMIPLLLNSVNEGKLKLQDVARLCSENPAAIFGLKGKGLLASGQDADITVVDMNKEWMIRDEDQLSKCGWTPYHGKETKGWPVITIVNGNIVFKRGEISVDKKGEMVNA